MKAQCPKMGMAGFSEQIKCTAIESEAQESIIVSESVDTRRYKDATRKQVARRDPERSSIGKDID
jgi:hypothetical protein